ncbi:hypothetical protein LCGC14_0264070 [marine sediment metagenome]|uniref:Uncharacterized protein n=1 Tax=marine sediment metagenome TaxID=412755 RepID=A0A0F9X5M6_9ZZZZ
MSKQKFIAGTVYALRKRFDIDWTRDSEAPAYVSNATDLEAVLTNMDEEGYDLVSGGSGDGSIVFKLRQTCNCTGPDGACNECYPNDVKE